MPWICLLLPAGTGPGPPRRWPDQKPVRPAGRDPSQSCHAVSFVPGRPQTGGSPPGRSVPWACWQRASITSSGSTPIGTRTPRRSWTGRVRSWPEATKGATPVDALRGFMDADQRLRKFFGREPSRLRVVPMCKGRTEWGTLVKELRTVLRGGREKERRDKRRRIQAGVVGIVAAIGIFVLLLQAFSPIGGRVQVPPLGEPTPTGQPTPTDQPTPTPPSCTPVEGQYHASLTPSSGPAGSSVQVSGPRPLYNYDESPPFDSSPLTFEVWWNVTPDQWERLLPSWTGPSPSPTGPGNVVLVGEVTTEPVCEFQLQFTVPDVPPGSYPIVVMEIWDGGGALYDSDLQTFEVTG